LLYSTIKGLLFVTIGQAARQMGCDQFEREPKNQQHKHNDQPIDRMRKKFPIKDFHRRASGCGLHAIVIELSDQAEKGVAQNRHQYHCRPIGEIPT
jgi:hypothetical protein